MKAKVEITGRVGKALQVIIPSGMTGRQLVVWKCNAAKDTNLQTVELPVTIEAECSEPTNDEPG